jgi:hypothetical protein
MDEYEIRQRQCKKGKELKEVGREKENKNTRKARGVGKLLGWSCTLSFPDNGSGNYDGEEKIIHFLKVSLRTQESTCPNGNGGLNREHCMRFSLTSSYN